MNGKEDCDINRGKTIKKKESRVTSLKRAKKESLNKTKNTTVDEKQNDKWKRGKKKGRERIYGEINLRLCAYVR